jgi:F-type H+-transporting ATPase subunit c
VIQAAKIIGTGLATTGLIGAGIGVVFGALILGVARNPSLRGQLFSYAILGFAFAEATCLFAFRLNKDIILGILYLLAVSSLTNITLFIFTFCVLSLFFPPFVFASAKTATQEEIERKKLELERQITEQAENKRERELANEEHSIAGDNDQPKEVQDRLAEYTEKWDELIKHTDETLAELYNWLGDV